VKKWDILATEKVGDFRVFSVRKQKNRSPDTGKEGDFFVLDAVDWVNVIALTDKDEVVLITQYRHGSDTLTLEIPGGCVDSSDGSPLVAAKRELEEETGYSGGEWEELGWTDPNPALFSNRCYAYLARGVTLTKAQALDGNEEIEVQTVPLGSIPQLIQERRVTHSLVISGFYFLDLWKKARGSSG
jgi:ADP-ribose pyrophosphatase